MKHYYPNMEWEMEMDRLLLSEKRIFNFKQSEHQLWMVTEGNFTLSLERKTEYSIENGQILFLPKGSLCSIFTSLPVCLFRFRFPSLSLMLEELYPEGLAKEKLFHTTSFNPLNMNLVIREYTRYLSVLWKRYPATSAFMKFQSFYFLSLLKESYSKHEISGFYYPIIQSHKQFILLVQRHYKNAKNVRELALLCSYSIRNFERTFKNMFGTSPGQWLLQKRVEAVRQEIISSKEPFMSIADKYRFTTPSQLSDFCKRHMGLSPSELRKGITK